MKKIQYSPEESLNRIKLMMGYDMSKTLNENKSIVLEQTFGNHTDDEILYQISDAVDGIGTDIAELNTALSLIANRPAYDSINSKMGDYTEYASMEEMLKGEIGLNNANDLKKIRDHFRTKLGLDIVFKIRTILGGQVGVDSDTIRIVEYNPTNNEAFKVENEILKNIPCLVSTPGYKKIKVEKNYLYFEIVGQVFAVDKEGNTYKKDSAGNYIKQNGKTSCPKDVVESYNTISEQATIPGLDNGGDKKTSSNVDSDNKSDKKSSEQTVVSQGSTNTNVVSNDVIKFQQQLKQLGVGQHLGTTGENGDGVDGKLGPKTAYAAWALLKNKGIVN
jgi:hypothetical protein